VTSRGYFGVAVWHPKHEVNIGSLWRSAHLYGAAFVATVGSRYAHRQASDTMATTRHTPLHHYDTIDDLIDHLPHSCPLVGVELDPRAVGLDRFVHPLRALYLLGAEDHGLPPKITDRCHFLVQIPTVVNRSMNVASAGTVVLADRHMNPQRRLTRKAMEVAGL
jgi:tRNA G18 (ribose-2'-O)-methylase SpoU